MKLTVKINTQVPAAVLNPEVGIPLVFNAVQGQLLSQSLILSPIGLTLLLVEVILLLGTVPLLELCSLLDYISDVFSKTAPSQKIADRPISTPQNY